MGVSSLDDVIEHVKDGGLRELLAKSKETHTKLGNTTHKYLNEYHDEGKEPAMMAKVLYKYLNQYPAAEGKIKQLAKDVAQAEDTLVKELRDYL